MGMFSGGRSAQPPIQYVTPGEKSSLMAELGQRSGQAIEALGLLLDTPGAITRGIIAGDPLSGFSFDRSRRVSGEQLLEQYGLKPENPYLATPAGFIADVALDPLAYASFGGTTAGKAGAAAAKAGISKYAPFVASLKEGAEATRTGRYTMDAITRAGMKPSTSVLQTRPLVGKRLANATTTLDEVVRAAPDPIKALQQVQEALGSTPYSEVAGDKIGGILGFTNPFTGGSFVINPRLRAGQLDSLTNLNWAERSADMIDRVGQGIAWSGPARLFSAAFDQSVGGTVGVADQITAMRRFQSEQMARRAGRLEATQHAQRLAELKVPEALARQTGVEDFFSPQGGDVLLRLVEGKPLPGDLDFLRQIPGLDDWIVQWRGIAEQKLEAAKALGLSAKELKDRFGTYFSPRSTPELDFTDAALGRPGHASQFSAHIANQTARNPNLHVPGGTYQLQQISLDPLVRGWAKGLTNESEEVIGAHIAQLIGNPLVDEKQGVGIARVMRRMLPDLPDNIPVFGTHPLLEQMGYIVNEEIRRSNAESALEALADAAISIGKTRVGGGKHISLSEALSRIGDRLGFQKGAAESRQMLRGMVTDSLFEAGTNPRSVRMSSLSVPEEVVNRIMRVSDFYSSPEAQQQVSGMYDKFTTLFKSSVLAWPSRFTRDMYSNMFSIWLENGNATETLKGLRAASKILNNQYDDVVSYLRQIPRYASAANDADLVRLFQQDVGQTGILSGLATTDLLSANRRGDIGQFLPGSTPISVSRALRQMVPDGTTTLGQKARDFFAIKGVTNNYETRNAIYNASQVLGDTVDSMGRLAGFMSLMRMGVAPEEAASRMMKALVDYSSLTSLERKTIRKIVPWWAFNSRIGAYAVTSLAKNPGGRYAQTIRAINDLQATTDESYIPTALRQRFAIRAPEFADQAGGGTRTYFTDIDLPGIDVLNMVRLGYQPDVLSSLLQTGQNTTGELLQQANPLIRSVAELATGQDFFSKRPIEQAVTPFDTIYRAATGDKYARINPLVRAGLANAVSAVPLGSRSVSMVSNLVDARVPNVPFRAMKALVNNTLGVKIQNVDAEYEALDALNKIKEQNSPYTSEFIQSYIPKELEPHIPLQNRQLNNLSKELQRELRQVYSRRYGR